MTANVTQLTGIKTHVPTDVANALKERAKAGERSVSAELRLAVRAHLAGDEIPPESTPEDVAA